MPSLNPTEWSKAVQMSIAGATTIGVIVGLYLGVEAWAEDKIESSVGAVERRMIEELAEKQAVNDINHSKIIQSARIVTSETQIEITELKLAQLEDEIDARTEDGKDPTARQERSMERLSGLLETYESVQTDATKKLTRITTTTTTTTTTTDPN